MSDRVTIRCRRCGKAIAKGRWIDGQFHPVHWHRMRTLIRHPGDRWSDDTSPEATRERSILAHMEDIEAEWTTDDDEFVGTTFSIPVWEIQCDRCGHWTRLVPSV